MRVGWAMKFRERCLKGETLMFKSNYVGKNFLVYA